jgi:hypothetical protein
MSDTTTTTTTPAEVPAKVTFQDILAMPAGKLTVHALARVIESKVYALPDAAKKANLDPRGLRAMCREGKIPGAVKLLDDAWLLPKAEFDSWLKDRAGKQADAKKLQDQMAALQKQMDELRAGKSKAA